MGPAIGFIATGLLLSVWVDLGSPPDGLTDKDPAFVGAWWLPFLIAAALSIPISLFGFFIPKQMPNTEHIRKELHQQESTDGEVTVERSSMLASLKVVVANKTTMCITAASVFASFITAAFAAFLPKIFQVIPLRVRCRVSCLRSSVPLRPPSAGAMEYVLLTGCDHDGYYCCSWCRWWCTVRWLGHQTVENGCACHGKDDHTVFRAHLPAVVWLIPEVSHTVRDRHQHSVSRGLCISISAFLDEIV